MSSSGLLCLGIVLLWAFAAVPQWVERRERLASDHAAEIEAEEARLRARRAADVDARSTARVVASTGSGRLAPVRPVAARSTAARPATAAQPARPARSVRPAPSPRVPTRRTSTGAAGAVLAASGLAVVVPALLAAVGAVPLFVAPVGLVAVAAVAALLRGRALSHADLAAQARAAARAQALARGRAQVRAAQARAGERRHAAEVAAVAAAAQASREAAAMADRRRALRQAVGQ